VKFVPSKLMFMHTLQQTYSPSYTVNKGQSLVAQFFSWCQGQEPFRFGWLAIILAVHGCVLTPITAMAIAVGGNDIVLWFAAISAMAMALVTNLAAMPTKVTIPVFFLSIVIDIVIMGVSLG
jgi:hypothetical protein